MAQQARGIGDVAGPDAWFRDLPIVTRYWFGGSLFCTLAVNFKIINGGLIPFVWNNVSSKLELWRLLSCFLYVGPVRIAMVANAASFGCVGARLKYIVPLILLLLSQLTV